MNIFCKIHAHYTNGCIHCRIARLQNLRAMQHAASSAADEYWRRVRDEPAEANVYSGKLVENTIQRMANADIYETVAPLLMASTFVATDMPPDFSGDGGTGGGAGATGEW